MMLSMQWFLPWMFIAHATHNMIMMIILEDALKNKVLNALLQCLVINVVSFCAAIGLYLFFYVRVLDNAISLYGLGIVLVISIQVIMWKMLQKNFLFSSIVSLITSFFVGYFFVFLVS